MYLAVSAALAFAACSSPTTVTPPPPPVGGLALACPAGVSATAAAGATSQVVSYAPATATGGTAPVNVTCAPVSGSSFTLGSTTVGCSASDAIGRTAVCTTTVTVKPHTLATSTIVAFGDSITAGENGLDGTPVFAAQADCPSTSSAAVATSPLGAAGATPQFIDLANSYPTLLQTQLTSRFPSQSITVVNRGWPGETAASGVNRLKCVLGVNHPDTLLLLEGINDLDGNFTTAATQGVVSDLQADIHNAHASGVSFVFVGTLLPLGTCSMTTCRGSKNDNVSISAANNLIATMVASEVNNGASLVDVYAAYAAADSPNFTTLIDTDGLHPTPAGNAVTAQTFLSAILAKVPVLSHRVVGR